MTLDTHMRYDTIGHEHMSSLIRWDHDNTEGLYFMLVECRDGRWFLESEFNDEEYDQFPDIYNETKSHEVVFYPSRLAALTRALEIANALCPLATKTELLNAIAAEQASTR
ncbi:hypothetical protein WL32_16960 [Burkholderia cepacia]|uniref:hypothetical protein n=1 Tax=Burkholderia cepacia TaxID=292 RepID=UPI000759A830|nr:hypothetical protein [Burkholderia cepacia]KWB20820.1 hypothetical protein WL32_16960 [Burkholderia cepacia]